MHRAGPCVRFHIVKRLLYNAIHDMACLHAEMSVQVGGDLHSRPGHCVRETAPTGRRVVVPTLLSVG